MKIESISKKDSKNVIINFSAKGGSASGGDSLVINYEVFLKSSLKKGMEISPDRFAYLNEENEKHSIKTEAVNYLAQRIHSEKELRIKLQRKKHKNELINEIIKELKEKELLDDYKFSVIYAEEKIRLKLWGEKKIRSEFMKKGISSEIISRVTDEKFSVTNNLENAVELASKKLKSLSYKNLGRRNVAEKIYAFLASRGYDYQTSRDAVEKILDEHFIE